MTPAPVTSASIATGEAVQLDVFVDSSTWEGQFDSLELWRARLSEAGPYEPLMGDEWSPARIPSSVTGDPPSPAEVGASVPIVGGTLELLVNEDQEINLTFTGVNPITLGAAATQIQTAGAGLLRSFVVGGKLVVETVQPGAAAILRVVGGTAAPLLGLPTAEPLSVTFGLDARIPLTVGISNYVFTDRNGAPAYFYKARFFNSLDRTVSSFGEPFNGQFISGVPATSMVLGFVDFVDANGKAKKNQEVLVYTRMNGTIIDGKVVVPSAPTRLLSDADGHVELTLVRGTRVTIAVAGTDLVRDIDVPTDTSITSFNFLDPTKGSNDLFKVQVPNIDYAARRSL